ncbi:glycoside hydrolase family 3 C-terminal domain-containing protein [Paenibacillus shenyangensis]|uniref:glycoside hydrolase family 3 C-terminal domain-containing protein n=1 Tax=Paenibacillus sp. A9 TaxID=1284352 RepID=UPI000372CF17|nr:glycoside hydrolase family 3 C-terminal domain-containing protein [Paenibacillus sp. A9]
MEQTTKYPFQDHTLELDQRVHDLVDRLTEEEKIESMLQYQPAVERLGVGAYKHGTEAAHGIAWLGEATFFPQPVGLACTWDSELMHRIGNVISDEARVMYKRNPAINGLTLWAPTVDMERDPRWGRNEEAYGEDPRLTGELATRLVQGIQGDHPTYLKAVATLKHFLGNNNEVDRGSGSSSIDPRNMREYYLKAFEQPFTEGKAQSMMTAYNSINGTPALLHPLVQEVVKGEWGMDGFIVSDAGDVMGIMNDHGYYDSHTPGVAESVKAGIDSITDDADLSKAALREALEQGLLSWEDIDRALFHTFRVRFRLGEFDPAELNPYAAIGEESMMTEEAKAVAAEAVRKSIVLLKNDNGMLPLSSQGTDDVAVIGELGDIVYRDWYSGTLPYAVTGLQGIEAKVKGKVHYHDGNDRVSFKSAGQGGILSVQQTESEKEKATVGVDRSADSSLPSDPANAVEALSKNTNSVFTVSDWGFGSYTIRLAESDKYWTADDEGQQITASADEAYGWFVKEVFGLDQQDDGRIAISTWNGRAVYPSGTEGNLAIAEEQTVPGEERLFEKMVLENGLEQAVAAARAAKTAIVFVGNNPLINGKEENDRPSLELPASQLKLIQEVYAANPNTVVVVVGSYPFAMEWVEEHIPAILYLSHAGPELGNAVADVLYGDYAPAGRLNMTWYRSEEQLGDLRDYDIIRSERTYQYFRGQALYPFGHGLTYAPMEYSSLELEAEEVDAEDTIRLSVTIRNTGAIDSDEVVQLYTKLDQSRIQRPLRTLQAFRRIHLAAGQSSVVTFELPVNELSCWDVTRSRYCVETGSYTLMVGRSSADIQLQSNVQVNGEVIPPQELTKPVLAENYDDYRQVHLVESSEGGAAVEALGDGAWILFSDAEFGEAGTGTFQARTAFAGESGEVQIRLDAPDGILIGTLELNGSAGITNWQNTSVNIQSVNGRHNVYLVLRQGTRIREFRFGQ